MKASSSEKGALGVLYQLGREGGSSSSFVAPQPMQSTAARTPPEQHLVSNHPNTGGREPWDLARFGRTVAFFNEDMSSPAKALTTLLTAPLKALVKMVAGNEAPVSEL